MRWNHIVGVVAELDLLADVLSGVRGRPAGYLLVEPVQENIFGEYMPERCFVVSVWDDGLDYDEDGNSYFDDYPGYWEHSFHRTQRGAEMEASWLEHHGIAVDRIMVAHGWKEEWNQHSPTLE